MLSKERTAEIVKKYGKNENAEIRLNTVFQAIRIHLALPI